MHELLGVQQRLQWKYRHARGGTLRNYNCIVIHLH